MKFRNLILLVISAFSLNACFIGDTDDLEVVYEPTLIELVCQTPEISTFCELMYKTSPSTIPGISFGQPVAAWRIQFSGRAGFDANTGEACASNVETVFAPSDSAFTVFFSNFPHWLDSTGVVDYDKIPTDSLTMIILHHIYADVTSATGAKLYIEIENPVCSEEQILRGSNNKYKMMDGNFWIFAQNPAGDVAALSEITSNFSSRLVTPDLATTDGVVYILNKVLGPF
ncbi:MAG: fasciclin domain-containing protein [Chitinophagales bacterium]